MRHSPDIVLPWPFAIQRVFDMFALQQALGGSRIGWIWTRPTISLLQTHFGMDTRWRHVRTSSGPDGIWPRWVFIKPSIGKKRKLLSGHAALEDCDEHNADDGNENGADEVSDVVESEGEEEEVGQCEFDDPGPAGLAFDHGMDDPGEFDDPGPAPAGPVGPPRYLGSRRSASERSAAEGSWGAGCLITWREGERRWQARCRHHRSTPKAWCVRTFQAGAGDISKAITLKRCKLWLNMRKDFDSWAGHWSALVPDEGLPTDDALAAGRTVTEPPADVTADCPDAATADFLRRSFYKWCLGWWKELRYFNMDEFRWPHLSLSDFHLDSSQSCCSHVQKTSLITLCFIFAASVKIELELRTECGHLCNMDEFGCLFITLLWHWITSYRSLATKQVSLHVVLDYLHSLRGLLYNLTKPYVSTPNLDFVEHLLKTT